MMNKSNIVKLRRSHFLDDCILGGLTIPGCDVPLFTLENPWRDNMRGVSCIPEGLYRCEPFSGAKYKAVYEVKNVVDRSYILFHSGNWAADTVGCILVGLASGALSGEPAVIDSRKAISLMKDKLGTEEFWLKVT